MTLQPGQLGDTGVHRYEIRCRNADGKIVVMGWSDNPKAFEYAVQLHPGHYDHHVIDRQATATKESEGE